MPVGVYRRGQQKNQPGGNRQAAHGRGAVGGRGATPPISGASCSPSTIPGGDNDESRTQPNGRVRLWPDVWRCRDSNPGPPTDPPRRLRAYPPVLFSSLAHRPDGGPSRTSRENLARAVTAPNAGQPEFIDTLRPASGRADRRMGGKEPVRASTYAARAKLSFAGKVSWRFNECSKHLGTQPRIHRTRRNLSSPDPCFQSTLESNATAEARQSCCGTMI
jgi:hypothetical protein